MSPKVDPPPIQNEWGETYWPIPEAGRDWPGKVILNPRGEISLIGIPNPIRDRSIALAVSKALAYAVNYHDARS